MERQKCDFPSFVVPVSSSYYQYDPLQVCVALHAGKFHEIEVFLKHVYHLDKNNNSKLIFLIKSNFNITMNDIKAVSPIQ